MSLKVRYSNPDAGNIAYLEICNKLESGQLADTTLIKDDATTTLYLVDDAGGLLVFKRYNTKNIWHSLRRNFQTSRAANCLRMANLFSKAGLAVAEPMAVIESTWGPFRGRSWYVCRYLDNELLLDYLGREQDEVVVEQAIAKVADIFSILCDTAMSHGDMKATNILVNNGSLVLIDLDAARKHGSGRLHSRAISRDRRRFLKNWSTSPELQQRFSRKLDELGIT